jgi:AcrR family transcriptional regulator
MTSATSFQEGTEELDDEVRSRLLDAAVAVFARQGYEGTKISDIVREAGLSTGAVYGRFKSKNELLRIAIVERAAHVTGLGVHDRERVADLIARTGRVTSGQLRDAEAVRLEAFVAARREPEVAGALVDASSDWRTELQPIVDAALEDGTIAPDVDPEAVLFFLRTVGLGLLLQRAAGMPSPDARSWEPLVARIIASFGDATQKGTDT